MSFLYNLFAEAANIPIGIFNISNKVYNTVVHRAGLDQLQIEIQLPWFNKIKPLDKILQKQPEWIRNIDNKDFLKEAEKQKLPTNPLYSSEFELIDRDGKKVKASSLVKGKVFVAVLRHLGCNFCWDYARQIKTILPQFEAQGFELLIISLGDYKQISHLEDSLGLPKRSVFVDQDLNVYKTLNFNGASQFFSSDALKALSKYNFDHLIDTMIQSYEPSAPPRKTDVLQLGGTLIIDGPKIIYARRDEAVGDHPTIEELLHSMKQYNGTK